MPNLVGIGNSQVPTNGMLGGMAYQDPTNVVFKNVEPGNVKAIKRTSGLLTPYEANGSGEVAFAKNNAAYSYNGNTVETDTSVNVGGVSTATHGKYTQLTIGGSPSKAHIKRVMYYSQRISNTQLRNLTS